MNYSLSNMYTFGVQRLYECVVSCTAVRQVNTNFLGVFQFCNWYTQKCPHVYEIPINTLCTPCMLHVYMHTHTPKFHWLPISQWYSNVLYDRVPPRAVGPSPLLMIVVHLVTILLFSFSPIHLITSILNVTALAAVCVCV